MRRLRAAAFVGLFAAAASAPQACSQKSNLVDKGGACFLAGDCVPGLVCVPQQNGSRICTDDLTDVAGKNPPEAGAGDANQGEGGDAPADGPPIDTGQDTGTDTGQDTSVTDTGGG